MSIHGPIRDLATWQHEPVRRWAELEGKSPTTCDDLEKQVVSERRSVELKELAARATIVGKATLLVADALRYLLGK